MKFSDYLINEDVVNLQQRRQQQASQQQMTQKDLVDTVIDQLDHAFAQALDDITEIVGDEVKALEIISKHAGTFYSNEVQY